MRDSTCSGSRSRRRSVRCNSHHTHSQTSCPRDSRVGETYLEFRSNSILDTTQKGVREVKMYLVQARLLSKEKIGLARTQEFFDNEHSQSSLKLIKQNECDVTAKFIVVQNLSWPKGRQLEKFLKLPNTYLWPQLKNRQLRFKFVIPLKPDYEIVIVGLEKWASSKHFCVSKPNFVTKRLHQRTIAYLHSKSDAEDLRKILGPFSEETNISVSYRIFHLFLGVSAIASMMSFALFSFSLVSKPIFVLSLIMFPFAFLSIISIVFRFVSPPIFIKR